MILSAVPSKRLDRHSSECNGLDPKGTNDGTRTLHLRRRRPPDRPGTTAAQPPRGGRAGRPSRPRRLRRRRAPPPRLRRLVAGRRTRCGPGRTKDIRLTSAVTVLSSDDPVRVFQDFATLDLLSGGRAEVMADRGSFIESFPLFGYDLNDYDELFAEKLDLLLKLREAERVTWSGKHRAPLDEAGVYPRPIQDPLPIWIAVGGTPGSVVRAGAL